MPNAPLAIYIHWPYCARICPYCDFNVYKQRKDDGLTNAIINDLTAWRDRSGPREIISVHFGGGTPSLMTGDDIARILKQIDALWGLPLTAEVGLEANPNNAAIEKLDAFKAAGINRLSLGVQSFHDGALKQLGRDHDGAAGERAIDAAVARFASVSADLIFGWQGQTQADLTADLVRLLSSGLSHISTYQLTVEAGTAFARAEARGDMQAVDSDRSADFYSDVCARLLAEGFAHYEVSNFAKPDHRSRHNLAYWQGHDYIGVGPGAHGRITLDNIRHASVADMHPKNYTARVALGKTGVASMDALSPEDWRDEYVLMGLRISEGISLARLNQLAPSDDIISRAAPLIESGHLQRINNRLRVTALGRPLLNHITEKLLVG